MAWCHHGHVHDTRRRRVLNFLFLSLLFIFTHTRTLIMEQELIELLLVAKKALSTGQAICAQANELSQESDRHVEIIERTWAKILFVRNHVLIQLSTLERIREFLSVKIDEVRSCIQVKDKDWLYKASLFTFTLGS